MIENFATLSVEEQIEFAKALLEKINSEKIFSEETNFEFTGVDADDIAGSLMIYVSQTNSISVPRKAAWYCDEDDNAKSDPGYDAEYTNTIYEDAEKAFKTLSAPIDGYTVTLEVADVDEDYSANAEIEVDSITHGDAGIGHYEYWGFEGYDSSPYIEVEGTITRQCDCSLGFIVEPNDAI